MAPEEVLLPGVFGSHQLLTIAERDFMEKDDLIVPIGSAPEPAVGLSIVDIGRTDEDHYLESYWQWLHPLYPVIDRTSFRPQHAPPLLKAAMLALGAQALHDAKDKMSARVLHERCLKVLKKVSI